MTINKPHSASVSAEENLHRKLDAIDKRDADVRAFIEVYREEALKSAKEVDKHIKNGKAGPLAGLVVAVKNNIAVKGRRLTCSSKMLENHHAVYNATVVEKLIAADAVIIGSVNLDEFACGVDGTYSALQITKNPLDLERVPGGSSAGSGASVAAGMCDAALGSDTGGSVRCPAAFCNAYGLKPTYGAVSRYGLSDLAMSLDQIGVISKDKAIMKRVFDVIRGPDSRDQSTQLAGNVNKKPAEIKVIGVPKEFFEGVDSHIAAGVKKKIKELEKHYEVHEVSIPTLKYTVPIYQLTMAAEFSSAMQKYDGLRYGFAADRNEDLYASFAKARDAALGKEIKRRIMIGTYITMKEFKDAWYTQALKAREVMKEEFASVMKDVDILAGPAMPTAPWKFGEKMTPLEMYMADVLTIAGNLTGTPAIVEPLSSDFKDGSIQFYARHFEDDALFEIK
jgi:aspartyl-tRNA(Asn)/glutamyl-tRNA(Gln) amidotransferase subunit A